MRKLDELHLRYPFYGSRRLKDALFDEYGVVSNRKRIQRLMRQMGIQTVYPGKDKRTTVKKPSASGLSLLAERPGDHAFQPGLVQ